jgi:hypothetical protein
VRWTDGEMSAEPLVETVVGSLIREKRTVQSSPGDPSWAATLDDAEPAALTILEALYEIGAQIIDWEGDVRAG